MKDQLMDFGEAVRMLKSGGCVARTGWNDKGMYLFLHTVGEIPMPQSMPGGTHIRPCIVMNDAQGCLVPGWLASQTDMLADDWIAVDGEIEPPAR